MPEYWLNFDSDIFYTFLSVPFDREHIERVSITHPRHVSSSSLWTDKGITFGVLVEWLEDRHLTSIQPCSRPSRLSPQSPCVFIRVLGEKIEARHGTSGSSSRMEVMMSEGTLISSWRASARKLRIRKLIALLADRTLIITSIVPRLRRENIEFMVFISGNWIYSNMDCFQQWCARGCKSLPSIPSLLWLGKHLERLLIWRIAHIIIYI